MKITQDYIAIFTTESQILPQIFKNRHAMFVISHLVCEVKTLIIVSILPKMNFSKSLILKIDHMFFLLRENTKCCSYSLFKMFQIVG